MSAQLDPLSALSLLSWSWGDSGGWVHDQLVGEILGDTAGNHKLILNNVGLQIWWQNRFIFVFVPELSFLEQFYVQDLLIGLTVFNYV
jgi:hypothetical protein